MQIAHYFAAFSGIALFGLAIVWFLFSKIQSIVVDDGKAGSIASSIREGAMTFLAEEYKIISYVLGIVVALELVLVY